MVQGLFVRSHFFFGCQLAMLALSDRECMSTIGIASGETEEYLLLLHCSVETVYLTFLKGT